MVDFDNELDFVKIGLRNPENMKMMVQMVGHDDIRRVENQVEEDGSIYSGQVANINGQDVKHGFGCQLWPEGSKYTGDWRNNFAHGRGVFHHANGDIQAGEFYQDRAHGYGAYIQASG